MIIELFCLYSENMTTIYAWHLASLTISHHRYFLSLENTRGCTAVWLFWSFGCDFYFWPKYLWSLSITKKVFAHGRKTLFFRFLGEEISNRYPEWVSLKQLYPKAQKLNKYVEDYYFEVGSLQVDLNYLLYNILYLLYLFLIVYFHKWLLWSFIENLNFNLKLTIFFS